MCVNCVIIVIYNSKLVLLCVVKPHCEKLVYIMFILALNMDERLSLHSRGVSSTDPTNRPTTVYCYYEV